MFKDLVNSHGYPFQLLGDSFLLQYFRWIQGGGCERYCWKGREGEAAGRFCGRVGGEGVGTILF